MNHHRNAPPPKQRLLRKRLTGPSPLNESVLCLVKTGCATCSQLVATVHTTLDTPLSDIRVKLTGIAASAKTRLPLENFRDPNNLTSQPAKSAPINYPAKTDLDAVTTARLHAFDLTAPFRFVRGGGCRNIARTKETTLLLRDVIPLIPPVGLPQAPQWQHSPPFGLVVLSRRSPTAPDDVQLREAAVVLFVAQGEFGDDAHSEKVVMERLLLQQQSYGRQTNVKQLSGVIHKWNGNVRDFIGRTPLHEYSFEGNFGSVKYLVSLNFVRVDERDYFGNTALHLAAMRGHLECVQALIENGANILAKNHSMQTPMHLALYHRNDTVVDIFCRRLKQAQTPYSDILLLVDHMGNHPVRLFDTLTPPVDVLIQEGNLEALRALCRHFLFPTKSLYQRRKHCKETVLHIAARHGNDDIVKFLLDEMCLLAELLKGDPNDSDVLLDHSKRSPLHIAAHFGQVPIVKRLMKVMPGFLAAQDISGRTPLMLALGRGHMSTAMYIAENGIQFDASICDKHGMTALHQAVSIGATDVASLLITKFGARIDSRVTTVVTEKRKLLAGSSRLAITDKQELCRFFRSIRTKYSRCKRSKAPPLPTYERHEKTVSGPSPLWCAVVGGAKSQLSASLLLAHGAGGSMTERDLLAPLLTKALENRQFDIAAALLRLIGPTEALKQGDVLSYFCEHVHLFGKDIVRWLVERKVGVEQARSALIASAKLGDTDTIQFILLSVQGHVSLDDVMLAAIRAGQELTAIQMARNGARLTAVEERHAPLVVAAGLGQEAIVRALSGLPSISTFDAVGALVAALRSVPASHSGARWSSLCVCLVRKILFSDSHVHPVELLHLAAAKGLFAVVTAIVEKLIDLPSDTRSAIVKSAPSQSSRPSIVVTPKVPPRRKSKQPKKRKSLYKAPSSFTRSVYVAPSATVLEHRQKHRDVFSYLADRGEHMTMFDILVELRLPPWRGEDTRGWNALDYALHRGQYQCALVLAASGLLPLKSHSVKEPSSKLGRLQTALKLSTARDQRRGGTSSAAASLRMLLEAVVELSFVDLLGELLNTVCRILRQANLNGCNWIMAVARCAVQNHQHAALLCLNDFVDDFAAPVADGGEELLLAAVMSGAPAPIVDLLLCKSAPTQTPSALAKTSHRVLKRSLPAILPSSTITPLYAAVTLRDLRMCQKLAICTPPIAETTLGVFADPFEAAVTSHRRGADDKNLAAILGALLKAGHRILQHDLLRVLIEKQCDAAAAVLVPFTEVPTLLNVPETPQKSVIWATASLIQRHSSMEVALMEALCGADAKAVVGELASYLRDHPTEATTLLTTAASNDHSALVWLLVLLGAQPSVACTRLHSVGAQPSVSQCQFARASNWFLAHSGISTMLASAVATHGNMLISGVLHTAEQLGMIELVSPGSLASALQVALQHKAVNSFNIIKSFADTHGIAPQMSKGSNILGMLSDSIDSLRTNQKSSLGVTVSDYMTLEDLHSPVALRRLWEDSPVSSLALLHTRIRNAVQFERAGLRLRHVTPITLAASMGDEQQVRFLLEHSANANCQFSDLEHLPSSLARRRALFGRTTASGTTRWKRTFLTPKRCDPYVPPSLSFRLTPLMVSVYRLAYAHPFEQTSRESLVQLLLRRGSLTKEMINPLAICFAKLQRWNLLVVLVEEALRVTRRLDDNDRFFHLVANEDVPPLLATIIGTSRHVLHAVCRFAARDNIILVARHCLRPDVESGRDAEGRTPLYHALLQKSVQPLETLIALQVPTSGICDHKKRRTALMVASHHGNLAAVAALLKNGNVNSSDADGNTALMLAAASGRQDVVELLLSAQADSSMFNDQGMTAAMMAAIQGYDNIALPMAQHFSRLGSYVSPKTSLLHCACIGGCQRLTEHILKTYESIGVFDEDCNGHSSLYVAYAFGRGGILRLLLAALQHRTETPAREADIDLMKCASSRQHFGWFAASMLMAAALLEETSRRSKFALPSWEQSYAPRLCSMSSTESRLLWCAKTNNAIGIRCLSDLNVVDDCFAIHEAAERGSLDVLQLLVALRMSDANAANEKGFLPIECAVRCGKEECAAFLLQHTRITPDSLYQSAGLSGTTVVHLLAMSSLHGLIPMVVQKMLKGNDASTVDKGTANSVLGALMSVDREQRTPFELSVLFGSAATALRIAQAIQQVSVAANAEATVTLPSTLFEMKPNFSPAVRALLFDFFGVQEVFTQSAFFDDKGRPKSRGNFAKDGNGSERLLFSDIRCIGVATMRSDPFCSPKLDHVYTVEHERSVLKQITQAMDLPFRLKFRPEGLKMLVPTEQVTVLQRLGSNYLMGKYASLHPKRYPLGTVELELTRTRSEVGISLEGSTIVERFYFNRNTFIAHGIDEKIDELRKSTLVKALTVTQTILKRISAQVKGMQHPLLKALQLRVDWNGLRTPSDTADEDEHRTTTGDLTAELIESLNTEWLPCVEYVLARGAMADSLVGVTEAGLRCVISAAPVISSVTLRFYKSWDDAQGPSKAAVLLEGADLVIPFVFDRWSPLPKTVAHRNTSQFITSQLGPLCTAVLRDVNLFRIHELRDAFITALQARMTAIVGKPVDGWKLKLEVEGMAIEDVPLRFLAELLSDTTEAVCNVIKPLQSVAKVKPAWKALTSSHLVASSVAQTVRSVVVLFTNKRQPTARRNGSRLMLCLTPNLAPRVSDIETALLSDTVEAELERLREQFPVVCSDMGQRLNTYLPSTSLLVDLPSLSDLPSDDDVLAALALLHYDRSALILQEIIKGVSVGWDTKLGSLVRRHVRQISVTLLRSIGPSHATVSLLESGHLVFHYSLQAVQHAGGRPGDISPWHFPNSQRIASMLLMQLCSLHPEVATLVDREKSFGCWCRAYGPVVRGVAAGETRTRFWIASRNVMNSLPTSEPPDDTFEFSSKSFSCQSVRVKKTKRFGVYEVYLSAPSTAANHKLWIRLHGDHILNSPLVLPVRPAPCSVAKTVVQSTFNTTVEKRCFVIAYQLHDCFGNRINSLPVPNLAIQGPSEGNPEGVSVIRWLFAGPGIVEVVVSVSCVAKEVTVPVRFQIGDESHVALMQLECIAEDTFEQIRNIRRGPVASKAPPNERKKIRDRTGLYFRQKVRENEINRKKRECRLVGGVAHRKFPVFKK